MDIHGRYDCCPLTNAVCCSDYVHCCPYGYTCNPPYCNQAVNKTHKIGVLLSPKRKNSFYGGLTVKKGVFHISDDQTSDIICENGVSCPNNSTCCPEPTSGYACCPFPEASCCGDGIHCCPEGYTCHLKEGVCKKNNEVIPISVKVPSKSNTQSKHSKQTETVNVGKLCPDGDTSCENNGTCCKSSNKSSAYHCCNLKNAVCCSDGKSCCPKGFKCSAGGK